MPDNARFCSQCGKKVSTDVAPPPVRATGRPGPKEEVGGGAAARAPKIPDPQVKRKIIAVVLTLAALALMATNWVTVAGEADTSAEG